jgi:cell division septation protein DedD
VKGLKYNDFRFIANQPITPTDIAAVTSADSLASRSSSSSEDSLAAAKQQQQQVVEMQPQLPSVGLRWVAACCNSAKVSAASADKGLKLLNSTCVGFLHQMVWDCA